MSGLVSPKLKNLGHQFDKFADDTQAKVERLFDAKKADLYDQFCNNVDSFTKEVEAQIETEPMEKLADLTSVNIMLQKQQLIETEILAVLESIENKYNDIIIDC